MKQILKTNYLLRNQIPPPPSGEKPDGTVYTGYIARDDSATAGANTNSYSNVTINNDSEWIVTNDSTINTLTVNDSKNFKKHVKDKDEKKRNYLILTEIF